MMMREEMLELNAGNDYEHEHARMDGEIQRNELIIKSVCN